MRTALLMAILTCTTAAGLDAIIIRHDRDDRLYRELATKYPAVCAIGRAGEGALIAPRWVLTAAHVATTFRQALGVTCGGTNYQIARVLAHPDWTDGGPHDLALIHLQSAVHGIEPAGVYDGDNETGMTVTFVGRGGTGSGLTGPTGEDRVLRAATNRIDRVDTQWLHFRFDAPPAGTDLEGISGPGDSGGPAFVDVNGRVLVAGVSVWGKNGGNGRGTYGAQEGYTRVSRYAAWIRREIS